MQIIWHELLALRTSTQRRPFDVCLSQSSCASARSRKNWVNDMALTKRSNRRMIHTKNCIMRGSNLFFFHPFVGVCLHAEVAGNWLFFFFKNFSPPSTIWWLKPVRATLPPNGWREFRVLKKISRLLWHSRLTVLSTVALFFDCRNIQKDWLPRDISRVNM